MLWIDAKQSCDYFNIYILTLTERNTSVLQSGNLLSVLGQMPTFWVLDLLAFSAVQKTVTEVGRDLCRSLVHLPAPTRAVYKDGWRKPKKMGFPHLQDTLPISSLLPVARDLWEQAKDTFKHQRSAGNERKSSFPETSMSCASLDAAGTFPWDSTYGIEAVGHWHPLGIVGARWDTHSIQKCWTHLSRRLNCSLIVLIKTKWKHLFAFLHSQVVSAPKNLCTWMGSCTLLQGAVGRISWWFLVLIDHWDFWICNYHQVPSKYWGYFWSLLQEAWEHCESGHHLQSKRFRCPVLKNLSLLVYTGLVWFIIYLLFQGQAN